MKPQTDNELVKLFISGNKKAIEILFLRHKKDIKENVYFIIKDESLAEDILQDTFIRIMENLSKGNYRQENFLGWALTISKNITIDILRRRKRKPSSNIGFETNKEISKLNDAVNGYSILLNKENSLIVENILYDLPDEQREVIILRYFGDLSFKEISHITNTSINTCLGRVRYALKNLKRLLMAQA